jgi:hypothetical protein
MPGVFDDTVFAAAVRAVLGTTHFPHIDEMDPPCVYQKTVHFPKSSATSTSIGTALCSLEDPFNVHGRHGGNGVYVKQERNASDSGDPESSEEASGEFKLSKPVKEEGSDSMLVTWHGPNDPEVCVQWLSIVPRQIDVFCKESNELVASQENLGHVSTMLPDFLRLFRICSLYCCGPRRSRAFSCQPRCRNPWAYIIPARVWNWWVI